MPEEAGNANRPTNTTAPVVKHRQRDPQIFDGSPDADVDDWLKNYERVSHYNHWDDSFKLANVVFFLKDTALRWFDNHEETINSWEGFKTAFADVFGKPQHRKQQARDQLLRRYQRPTETSTAYIEDVLRLCRRVDAEMAEDEKIRHLFKGISQELFSVVAPKAPATTECLIAECRQYEELDSARISKKPFERLPEVSQVTTPDTNLASLIRTIIREELRTFVAQLQPSSDEHQTNTDVHGIKDAIQSELRAALGHVTPAASPYAPAAPVPTSICAYQSIPATYAAPTPPWTQPQPRTNIWRTPDQRPVCYYCHTPGHILRYCRRRLNNTARTSPTSRVYSTDYTDYHATHRTPPIDEFSSRSHTSTPPGHEQFPDSRRPSHSPERSPPPRRGRPSSPYPPRRRSVSPFTTDAPGPSQQSN